MRVLEPCSTSSDLSASAVKTCPSLMSPSRAGRRVQCTRDLPRENSDRCSGPARTLTGMSKALVIALLLVLWAIAPAAAYAQRFSFERSFDVKDPSTVDVSTLRGKIDIVAGEAGRIVVAGEATVRVGWDVPANALELARQVAAAPPIEREGQTIRLRRPSDEASQRAVTVSYRIRVPRSTEIRSISDSGATSVRGVDARVDVRTQSATIDLSSLSGQVTASSGSGAVTADRVVGPLTVSTVSSAFAGTSLGSSLHVRTQSGEVEAAFDGTGDVDVETGSSAVRLRGVRGGLIAKTQSGRVTVQGAPRREWLATTSSSSVNLNIESGVGFSIDAASRSGSVIADGEPVQGSVAKRAVTGTVHGGGPLVRVNSGSGSIRLQISRQ